MHQYIILKLGFQPMADVSSRRQLTCLEVLEVFALGGIMLTAKKRKTLARIECDISALADCLSTGIKMFDCIFVMFHTSRFALEVCIRMHEGVVSVVFVTFQGS